jgi:hypothetical protein
MNYQNTHEHCLDWGECTGLCYHKLMLLKSGEKPNCHDIIIDGKCPIGCIE